MVLPIIGYGHPTLRVKTEPITKDYPNLDELIENMFETMYNAHGVGLAAPQVNIPIRIFIVDGSEIEGEDGEDMSQFKKVFINPEKIEEVGTPWAFEEGCLSIPDIRENVRRPNQVTIRYFDLGFNEITETFDGMQARVVQHEYDHLEGVLFTDHISNLRKSILKTRLNRISKGDISLDYPMKFPKKK